MNQMSQNYFNALQKYSLTPWDDDQSTHLQGESQLKHKKKKIKIRQSKNKDISFRLYRQELQQLQDSNDKIASLFSKQKSKNKGRKNAHEFSLPPINSLVKINIGSSEQPNKKQDIKYLMSNTSVKKINNLNNSARNLRKYATLVRNQEQQKTRQEMCLKQQINTKLKLNGVKCTRNAPSKGPTWVQQLYSSSNINYRSATITPYQYFANKRKEDVFKRVLIQLQAKIK